MKCDSGHSHGLHGTKSDEHQRIEYKDGPVSINSRRSSADIVVAIRRG